MKRFSLIALAAAAVAQAQPPSQVQGERMRVLFAEAHRASCAGLIGNSWATVDFRTVDPRHVTPFFEARAARAGLSLDAYLRQPPASEKSLFAKLLALESLGASDMTMALDLTEPAMAAFHDEVAKVLVAPGPRLVRVFGLGERTAELDAVLALVREQARRRSVDEEKFCHDANLRFGFYDVLPSALNTVQRRLDDAKTPAWLRSRAEVRWVNFTVAETFDGLADGTTAVAFCRNTFRGDLTTKGAEVLRQFRRLAAPKGLFVTDGSADQALRAMSPPALERLLLLEQALYELSGRDWDFRLAVWRHR